MKRIIYVLLAMLLPLVAFAAEPRIQESMVITGAITVNTDGSVASYMLNDADNLPPAVRQIVQATVPVWQFMPVEARGKPVVARTGMALRIVADLKSIHATQATIRVAGAAFGCEARSKAQLPGECPEGRTVTMSSRLPPRYPMEALRARIGGEVYLAVEIGRDGHVLNVAPRQVNLYSLTDQQARFRKVLADASVEAARKWTFRIPTEGPNAGKQHWIATVPIHYTIGSPSMQTGSRLRRTNKSASGQWRAYVPGPVQVIPWDDESPTPGGADAVAGSGVPFIRDPRFVLKDSVAGDTGQS